MPDGRDSGTSFKLGEHDQAISSLLDGQARIESAVTSIQLSLAERKGERKAFVAIASAAGALGGAAFPFLKALIAAKGAP